MHGGEEEYMRDFGVKAGRKDPDVGWRIILKCILDRQRGMDWIELVQDMD
jgi:hypothetical protein